MVEGEGEVAVESAVHDGARRVVVPARVFNYLSLWAAFARHRGSRCRRCRSKLWTRSVNFKVFSFTPMTIERASKLHVRTHVGNDKIEKNDQTRFTVRFFKNSRFSL